MSLKDCIEGPLCQYSSGFSYWWFGFLLLHWSPSH